MNRVYPDRVCIICNKIYTPTNSIQKSCNKICQGKLHSITAVVSARKRRDKFYKERGYYPGDKKALKAYSAEWYANLSPEKQLLRNIKSRAARDNIPFNLTLEDLIAPEFCPVLGIKLIRGRGQPEPTSPSCDRIIPELGYIKGNTQMMSALANVMKNKATPEQLLKFAEWINANYKNN